MFSQFCGSWSPQVFTCSPHVLPFHRLIMGNLVPGSRGAERVPRELRFHAAYLKLDAIKVDRLANTETTHPATILSCHRSLTEAKNISYCLGCQKIEALGGKRFLDHSMVRFNLLESRSYPDITGSLGRAVCLTPQWVFCSTCDQWWS